MHVANTVAKRGDKIVSWTFLAFMTLVLVGLEPFTVQTWERFQRVASGEGDVVRQIAYLATLFLLLTRFHTYTGSYLNILPATLVVALLWLVLSCGWSLEPDLSLRRVGLTLIATAFIFTSIHLMETKKAIALLKVVFGLVIICNLVSVGVLQSAVHQASDFVSTNDTVGAWRGMHFEKNIAAMIAAMGALFFFHCALERGRTLDWLFFVGEVVFVIGTKSKTSLGLLAFALMCALVYRCALRAGPLRQIIVLLTVVAAPMGFFIILLLQDDVQSVFSDPTILTNRGYIWNVVFSSIPDRFLTGYGFRSFWIDDESPVSSFAGADWVLAISHAHNGYLEILIGTGYVGLLLCVIATVAVPLRNMLSFRVADGALWVSWVIFFLLVNATETELFERDRPAWVLFLIAIAALHKDYSLKPSPDEVTFNPNLLPHSGNG